MRVARVSLWQPFSLVLVRFDADSCEILHRYSGISGEEISSHFKAHTVSYVKVAFSPTVQIFLLLRVRTHELGG